MLAWSRGDAGVRRGTPACGGMPGSGKIVEDLASADDPGNGGVPLFPLKPDLPRKYFFMSYWRSNYDSGGAGWAGEAAWGRG